MQPQGASPSLEGLQGPEKGRVPSLGHRETVLEIFALRSRLKSRDLTLEPLCTPT